MAEATVAEGEIYIEIIRIFQMLCDGSQRGSTVTGEGSLRSATVLLDHHSWGRTGSLKPRSIIQSSFKNLVM